MVTATEISADIWKQFSREHSIETRNVILMHYLHLVNEIGRRLAPAFQHYYDYDDLVSSGILGLMDAIEKFDYEKGIKFETYASIRIKGSMIDQIRKQDWIPKSLRQKFKKIEEAYTYLEVKNSKFPKDEEVAHYLGMSSNELAKLQKDMYVYHVMSLDEQIMKFYQNDDDIKSGDDTPEKKTIDNEFSSSLAKMLDKLTENERMVVNLFYFEELNQKEISKVLGLTESRVSQLHSRALIKLKSSYVNTYL